MIICGIDYGSKLAGTTVIASLDQERQTIALISSQKGQDADNLILTYAAQVRPKLIFIDAPLSLPGVYANTKGYTDYFFRQADKQLQAMSPMFIGGLTARAMKLKKELEALTIQVYETYPAAQARQMDLLPLGYKKQLTFLNNVLPLIEQELQPALLVHGNIINNWHQADALLALIGAIRFVNGKHLIFGEEKEGVILV